ncbi:DUF1330 domain-containing protein [Hasllibacter sp. MH4015]|uniref:DUF1330 domain-containing protein n=1 Tax=Hasllibacter sp. MH4015 TaxID=2854029 RepID=UPI001CD3B557|nr:DUF1330 domain-containing protein [Hasllibacter sp. MH4015]
MAHYVIAQLDVTDPDAFMESYAKPLGPLYERHGGKVIAASMAPAIVEGASTANMVAVLEFPSEDAFENWYGDPDYKPLLAKRRALTRMGSSRLIALPGT